METFAEKSGREWARLLLEEHFALRAALEQRVPVVGADGVERDSVRDSQRHLETVVGTVTVPRKAYQATGREDLHPMDAALNLPPELFSHGVQKMVSKEIARASFDEVVALVSDYSGAQIAKRQVAELIVRGALDFDAFYELRKSELVAIGDLLVISTDGKGIVVRHEDLREATRRAAEQSTHKIETRLTPGEKPQPETDGPSRDCVHCGALGAHCSRCSAHAARRDDRGQTSGTQEKQACVGERREARTQDHPRGVRGRAPS